MTKEELKQKLAASRKIQQSASTEFPNPQSLPSPIQMTRNLLQSVGRNVQSVAAGNNLRIPPEQAQNRLAICNACEYFLKPQQRCGKCGCYMAVKTHLKAEKCPVGKW
jgi:uncharacterized paraquat-inducible protein A